MTTYRIQYKSTFGNHWVEWRDNHGFAIEVLSLAAAIEISKTAAAAWHKSYDQIRIVDSKGEYHDIETDD